MRHNRLTTMLLALLCATCMKAAVNPKAGFIITNSGDTIQGTIDYRSDSHNAAECRFMAQGESEYRIYSPTDIQGYRLKDNGAYYVTRTFPVNNTDQTFFAEYLLQGGTSLYFHAERYYNYYYLVNPEGSVATIKQPLTDNREQTAKEKQDMLKEAAALFWQSPEAINQLWKSELTSRNLSEITRRYNEEFCTEQGDCVTFEYDEKKTSDSRIRLRMEAGLLTAKMGNNHGTNTEPQIGIGADLFFPRSAKGLSAQALLVFSSRKEIKYPENLTSSNHYTDGHTFNIQLQLGLAYTFLPDKKISPVIRGGAYLSERKIEASERTFFWGGYIGAGVDMKMGKHELRLSVNYESPEDEVNNKGISDNNLKSAFSVRLGFLL